jgi:FMN phosphatase YigB (HAD superfamily)
MLNGLQDWTPSYRTAAWSAVAAALWRRDPEVEAEIAAVFLDRQRRGHPVIRGAHRMVESISSEYSVGLVTNGPPDVQRLKLEQSELLHPFA